MAEQLSILPDDVAPPTPVGPTAQAAFDAWNDRAKKYGWAQSRMLEGRANALRARLRDIGGLHNFIALLDKCGASDFLCGRVQSPGRRPFRFDLDWFLRPANFGKVWDGRYFSDEVAPAQGNAPPVVQHPGGRDPLAEDRAKLRRYRPGGFWPSSWGPRPEEEACRLPGEVLAPWREQYKVTPLANPKRVETREERLEASIRAHDRVGNHARADALRGELAKLRGESVVVMPPCPEARQNQPKPSVPPEVGGDGYPEEPFDAYAADESDAD